MLYEHHRLVQLPLSSRITPFFYLTINNLYLKTIPMKKIQAQVLIPKNFQIRFQILLISPLSKVRPLEGSYSIIVNCTTDYTLIC